MSPWLWACVVGLAVLVPAVLLFNRLVAARNLARQGYADIDVQLKRRADLVPPLVEAVKGYAAYEKALLTTVAEARSAALVGQARRRALRPRALARPGAEAAGRARRGLSQPQGRRQLSRPVGEAGRSRGPAAARAALLQRRGEGIRDAHRVVSRPADREAARLPPDAVLRAVRFLLLSLVLFAGNSEAVERVLDFHSEIRIAADGTLTVTEVIAVQAEGQQIRRGILRDFPTDYRDRARRARGGAVRGAARVAQRRARALQDRAPGERRARAHRRSGQRRCATAATPTRSATAPRARSASSTTHDELYWNVNGNGWTFAFDSISAEVKLPQPVPAADLKAEAFTGPVGAQGRSYQAFTADGSAAFRSTRPFQPREGMTIVVAFPKGVVARPTPLQRAGWFLSANLGVAAGLGGLALFVAFLCWRWSQVGRDPRAGPRFPRYEPPAGLRPGGRALRRQDGRRRPRFRRGAARPGRARLPEDPPGRRALRGRAHRQERRVPARRPGDLGDAARPGQADLRRQGARARRRAGAQEFRHRRRGALRRAVLEEPRLAGRRRRHRRRRGRPDDRPRHAGRVHRRDRRRDGADPALLRAHPAGLHRQGPQAAGRDRGPAAVPERGRGRRAAGA